MSNDKHTPTPWMVVESKNKNESDVISDQNYIAQLKHFSDDDITFDRLVFMNGKGKRVTDPIESIGKANAARIVQCVNEYDGLIETIATLRAEKAELIEALIKIQEWTDKGSDALARIRMSSIASQTLAKHETK
jgi:hypothetical protein